MIVRMGTRVLQLLSRAPHDLLLPNRSPSRS